jgi:hypothetical protein
MTDLSQFDPNSVGNPNNNIFGLPFTEEDAALVIVPGRLSIFLMPVCRLICLTPMYPMAGSRAFLCVRLIKSC